MAVLLASFPWLVLHHLLYFVEANVAVDAAPRHAGRQRRCPTLSLSPQATKLISVIAFFDLGQGVHGALWICPNTHVPIATQTIRAIDCRISQSRFSETIEKVLFPIARSLLPEFVSSCRLLRETYLSCRGTGVNRCLVRFDSTHFKRTYMITKTSNLSNHHTNIQFLRLGQNTLT